jgi:hypothetical protein
MARVDRRGAGRRICVIVDLRRRLVSVWPIHSVRDNGRLINLGFLPRK